MELISVKNDETTIINTFNAKFTLREDIAEKLLGLYNENSLVTDTRIVVTGNEAKVTGKLTIEKRHKLTSVNFYFERVEWNSGMMEIYKEP